MQDRASNVRSLQGTPIEADFLSSRGSPIVIDNSSGNERLFILNSAGVITELTTITLKDTAQLDAFGRLRTSTPTTVFDSQQEYGLDTRTTWDITANGTLGAFATNGSVSSGGNLVGPRNVNTRLTPITVSTTNGHYSIMQSKQYVRYVPGKSHIVFMTGVFSSGTPSSVAVTTRTSTSGAIEDTDVLQANWNLDKLDGTGTSGITIDFTKSQILIIDAQWLGAGRVRIGFDIDGVIYYVHEFLNANNISVPYTQTLNLPIRMEGRSNGTNATFRTGYFDLANGIFLKTVASTAGGTIQFNSCSVQTEGGGELRGVPWSSPIGISTVSVTTRRPILSIRPKATFQGITNRAHIEELEFLTRIITNDSFIEIVYGGVPATGTSWTSANTDSAVEYDVSSTTITGGVTLNQFFGISGGGTGSNQRAGESKFSLDTRTPLTLSQIDALTATQTVISLVATSFTGTSSVTAIANWHEQTI